MAIIIEKMDETNDKIDKFENKLEEMNKGLQTAFDDKLKV